VKKIAEQSKLVATSTQTDQNAMIELIQEIDKVSNAMGGKINGINDSLTDITALNSEGIAAAATSFIKILWQN